MNELESDKKTLKRGGTRTRNKIQSEALKKSLEKALSLLETALFKLILKKLRRFRDLLLHQLHGIEAIRRF